MYGALPLLHPLSQDRSGRLWTFRLEAQDVNRLHVLLVGVLLREERAIAPFSSRRVELLDELYDEVVSSFGACLEDM